MPKQKTELSIPLFVALDVDDSKKALRLADDLKPYVGGFKVGPRLTFRYGSDFVKELSRRGPVFVDNKYCDIPNTMEHSIRASFEAGASFCTIHAACGPEAMAHLKKVEDELSSERPFKLLVVTVLTSISEASVPPNWVSKPIQDQVHMLAKSAVDAGLTGIVCSAHEVQNLREHFPAAFLVTPGIRFLNEESGDQKRIMGPQEALEKGASALVVGRPICDAPDPIAAAQKWYQYLFSYC